MVSYFKTGFARFFDAMSILKFIFIGVNFKIMRIALVHDYLNQFGGEERVLKILSDIFPEAPIYTLIYDKEKTRFQFEDKKIISSALQNVPYAKSNHKIFSVIAPILMENFDFSNFDLVISLTASFAKGIILKPRTQHLCYLNTPTRFFWDDSLNYLHRSFIPRFLQPLSSMFMTGLRIWDRQVAQRPDYMIANSNFVSKRIQKYYRRDAEVVHPPIDMKTFYSSDKRDDYYLMVGRLIDYKRFDLGIEVCKKNKRQLKIVGVGPEYSKLKKLAENYDNIEFTGYLDENALSDMYSNARALIWPQEEDFGLVQVEAIASGCPVIAYRAGGALEVVQEGINGIFFESQDIRTLSEALREFENTDFERRKIIESVRSFDIDVFERKFRSILNEVGFSA